MPTSKTIPSPHRRAFSLVGLLMSIGIMAVLYAIMSTMMTGTGPNNPGVKQNIDRKINVIYLHEVYRGFQMWSLDHKGKFPSTKDAPSMEDDTTHQVFKALLSEQYIAGQHLISRNEHETGFYEGYADTFGPKNTSFALNDYDADDWLRYEQWGDNTRRNSPFLSDRWVEIENYEYNNINDTFWFVLYTDGHSVNAKSSILKNGDDLFFEDDDEFGASDALMVHD